MKRKLQFKFHEQKKTPKYELNFYPKKLIDESFLSKVQFYFFSVCKAKKKDRF